MQNNQLVTNLNYTDMNDIKFQTKTKTKTKIELISKETTVTHPCKVVIQITYDLLMTKRIIDFYIDPFMKNFFTLFHRLTVKLALPTFRIYTNAVRLMVTLLKTFCQSSVSGVICIVYKHVIGSTIFNITEKLQSVSAIGCMI